MVPALLGGTSLYDCVAQTASDLLSRSQNPNTPRRLIIVLTDGKDNYSQMSFDEMLKSVQREGVAAFTLAQDVAGTPSKMQDFFLKDFARNTGGVGLVTDPMQNGVEALITAVQGQLVLSITPPQAAGAGLHALSVQTSEKGIRIAAPVDILIP